MTEEIQQLREAMQSKDHALLYLRHSGELQSERWGLVRRVIEDAGKQYAAMRQDVVEERLKDQGPPLWLSAILIVGVTLIPVSALTSTFLLALTTSTQKVLTRADRKLLQSTTGYLKRDRGPREFIAAQNLRLSKQIGQTEEMVGKFAKNLEPELANKLQDAADALSKTLSKPLFMQDRERKMVQTDAPIVVVTQALHRWVNSVVHAELAARHKLENKIQDLFDIATSPEPAKEAKAKEAEAQKEARKSPTRALAHLTRPFREEPLPKTNKAALSQLSELRNDLKALAPATNEKLGQFKFEDLRELMIFVELMIWATTYDFTPRIELRPGGLDPLPVPPQMYEAPLPEVLWKRLIERYIDPDEGKTYKDVGKLDRLGTKSHPYHSEPGKKRWSPEVRLSHYFSRELYPQINAENSEMVRRFSSL